MPYTHSAQRTFENLLKEKEVPKQAVNLAGSLLESCKEVLGAEKFDELFRATVSKTIHGFQSAKEADDFSAFLNKNGFKDPSKTEPNQVPELDTDMFSR